MKRDSFLLIILAVLSVSSAIAAVAGLQVWPLLLCASLVMLVVCVIEFYLNQRRALKPTAQPRSDVSGVPSPDEITAQIERVRRFLNGERGTGQLPQPQKAITVACSACDVAEVYPEGHGNDAAKSAHLLTHPDRCMVVGIRQ